MNRNNIVIVTLVLRITSKIPHHCQNEKVDSLHGPAITFILFNKNKNILNSKAYNWFEHF